MTMKDPDTGPADFEFVIQSAVPRGRDGKHKQIALQLLDNISQAEAWNSAQDSDFVPVKLERKHKILPEPGNQAAWD